MAQRKPKNEQVSAGNPEQATVVELRRLAKVIAYAAIKDNAEAEQAIFLDSVGYTSPEIAEMMGIKPNYARALISRARRARKTRNRKQIPQD